MSKDLMARLEDRLRDNFDADPRILAQDDVGGLRVESRQSNRADGAPLQRPAP